MKNVSVTLPLYYEPSTSKVSEFAGFEFQNCDSLFAFEPNPKQFFNSMVRARL